MDSYQCHFRKADTFFSEEQKGAITTDRKIYFLLLYLFLHGGNDFQSSCICFDIFNNAISFGSVEKQIKGNYVFL